MTCVVQFPSLPISSPARAPHSLFRFFPLFTFPTPLAAFVAPIAVHRPTPPSPTSAIPSPNRSPFSLQPFPTTAVHRILRKTLVQSLPTCSSLTTFSFFLPPPTPSESSSSLFLSFLFASFPPFFPLPTSPPPPRSALPFLFFFFLCA